MAFDARGIADAAVLHGHVEIDAQEHALALEVGLIERAKPGHLIVRRGVSPARFVRVEPQTSFPMATAVSTMRFENPHSLSYHDMTRTKFPSITLV